jgi:hypothetical protein
MAHVKDMNILPVTFKADLDLSSYQYYVLMAASTDDYVKICTGGSEPIPLGVQQDDSACNVGDAVAVAMFGPTYAQVAACDLGGNACPIGYGDLLVCASNGVLRRAGSDTYAYNARALKSVTTACNSAVIPVFFYGIAGCALTAS